MPQLFCTARWKAYLRNLQNVKKDDADAPDDVIYHIYHSQMLWFVRDEGNNHLKVAEEHLKRCNELLEDCTTIVNELEDTLAKTPKPSEVLDWSSIW